MGVRLPSAVLAACAGTALLVTLALYTSGGSSNRSVLVNSKDFPTSPVVEYIPHPLHYDIPDYEGATDEDQSPQIPRKFEKEQQWEDKQEKRMMALLERQSKEEDGIDKRISAISTYVDDEVSNK